MVIELALSSAQLPLRHSVVHPRFGKGVEGVHNAHVSGLKLGCDYLDRWDHSESEGGHRGSPFFLVLRDGSRVTGGDWPDALCPPPDRQLMPPMCSWARMNSRAKLD